VALTKNKAIFLYTGKIVYYSHDATDTVKLMFSNSFTINEVDVNQASRQYKAIVRCYCSAVSRFTCFATTLNCIILTKAAQVC